MIRRIIITLILVFVITSCGGAAATAPAGVPLETELPATEAPATEPPAFQSLSAPTREAEPTETPVPLPTQTQILPTRTDTPLPTLELPTEMVNAPQQLVWDGTPTYPGDSTPGFVFRVSYDPDLWALTTDQFGFPALAHRNIAGCIISPTSGRGLPATTVVEHDILALDAVTFDVSIVSENGVRKFVTYTGGDGTVITAFVVDFTEDVQTCLVAAVGVLSTLTSIPVSQATPQP
ncbi:MAG: hypothetical protein M3R47_13490 [Chloroflexota bacterium]|nr:hypothetical protein [Chloroflexota bacterium]